MGIADFFVAALYLILHFLLIFTFFGPIDRVMLQFHVPGLATGGFFSSDSWIDQTVMAILTLMAGIVIGQVVSQLMARLNIGPFRDWTGVVNSGTSIIFCLSVIIRQDGLVGRLKGVAAYLQKMGCS